MMPAKKRRVTCDGEKYPALRDTDTDGKTAYLAITL
jgi:hypothetical protein